MKKALQITLAGNLFTIEEDAYEILKNYLNSIKDYFAHITDSDDVVEDIEARIAEQLLEKIKNHNDIVTLADVSHVMESMGTIEEISGTTNEGSKKSEPTEETTSTRRLYRSSDDVVIAGVASGIASYMGLDAFAMRIIFVIAFLATGGGFLFLYVAAALLIPQAKTATDKVKMRGGPVTLASFKENFNEQMHTVKKNGQEILKKDSTFRTSVERLFYAIGNIIRMLIKILVKIIGIFLIAGAAFAMIVQIFIAGNLLFNYNSPYIDIPLAQVISQPLFYLFVLIAFALFFIPTFFIGTIGTMIITGKSKIAPATAMILGGVWIIALILAGTIGVRTSFDVRQRMMNLPEYQSVTQELTVSPFTEIELQGNNTVTYVEGAAHAITVNGRQVDIDSTQFNVENGSLTVTHKPQTKICFICTGNEKLKIQITAPNIESIILTDGVNFTTERITSNNIVLTLHDGAYADMTLDTSNTTIEMRDGARLLTHGTTTNLVFNGTDGTRFDGNELIVNDATLTLTDAARAHIESLGRLQITAADGSYVTYIGTNPTINTEDGARADNVSTSTKRAVDLSGYKY